MFLRNFSFIKSLPLLKNLLQYSYRRWFIGYGSLFSVQLKKFFLELNHSQVINDFFQLGLNDCLLLFGSECNPILIFSH